MKFSVAPRTINFPISRFVSENGRWEVGLVPMLFGVRVRAGIVGRDYANVDYCAGDNPAFALALLVTIMEILSWLTEDITGGQVERMMPAYQRRPIDQDPCWERLQEMAQQTKRAAPIGAAL